MRTTGFYPGRPMSWASAPGMPASSGAGAKARSTKFGREIRLASNQENQGDRQREIRKSPGNSPVTTGLFSCHLA